MSMKLIVGIAIKIKYCMQFEQNADFTGLFY